MMSQWQGETLVAIQQLDTKKYKVVELPARAVESMTSRGTFTSEDSATQYIEVQYEDRAITVQMEDITEEIALRKASLKKEE